MASYSSELASVQEMLRGFVRTKQIEITQLSKINELIKKSTRDQFRILNSSLPFDEQQTMFGAVRNINTAVKGIKAKLTIASEKHENPTTAEQALDLMDNLHAVANFIDNFARGELKVIEIDEIAKVSRILYRKAKSYGFCEDEQVQLKEAGVTKEQIRSFVNSFDSNVSQELGIEEDIPPATKDSN
jgi:hypothetical protein